MKWLIILWAVYAIAVGAQGLWDFEERPIGFYSGLVAIASLIPLIFFAVELRRSYGDAVWLAMTGGSLILSVLAGMVFFYLAIPFNTLRMVAGWFLMIGGAGVAIIGMAIVTTAITVS